MAGNGAQGEPAQCDVPARPADGRRGHCVYAGVPFRQKVPPFFVRLRDIQYNVREHANAERRGTASAQQDATSPGGPGCSCSREDVQCASQHICCVAPYRGRFLAAIVPMASERFALFIALHIAIEPENIGIIDYWCVRVPQR